jgi:putative phosphonate metabolism protein
VSGARFAIYYAPEEDSPLARFGWAWLGRDPRSANDAPFPVVGLDSARHADLVAEPRRYGLHATLKPPFHLAVGTKREQLVDSLARFCAAMLPVEAPALMLGAIEGFLALQPRAPAADLDRLAARCVEVFDRFRAAPSEAEIARRLAANLTARQRAMLDRWGYPYVMDEFRFHITLTGRLDETERAAILDLLAPHLIETTSVPLHIGSLCLFEQLDTDKRFVLTARFPLGD